jgi:nucleoside-diphosphate-sugar epimerase
MKVLVTGAAGFLGGHVVDTLRASGDDVRAFARASSDRAHLDALSGLDVHVGDLEREDDVRGAMRGIDAVVHAAARVTDFGSRATFERANVDVTERLLRCARAEGAKRFVFVSSPSIVMDGTHQRLVDERRPLPRRFANLYAETKARAERLVLDANAAEFTTCALRPRAVWGPRDKHGFFPKLLAKMRDGKLPNLSGDRTVHASLCHVDDAARACALALRAPDVGGRAYFITDGIETDVWAFVEDAARAFALPPPRRRVSPRVARALGGLVDVVWRLPALGHHRPPPLSRYAVELLTLDATYDITAARRDLAYAPRVTPAAGLAALVDDVARSGGLDRALAHVA